MPGAVHEGRCRERLPTHATRAANVFVKTSKNMSVGATTAQGRNKDVAMPPQHTFWHARSPARIEDVKVVGVPFHLGSSFVRFGQSRFIVQRAW